MLGFPIFGQFYHFLVACLTEFYVHTQATLPVSPFLQDMPSPTSSRQIEWGRFQADSLKPVHSSCELHEKKALSLPGLELPSSWMGVGGRFLGSRLSFPLWEKCLLRHFSLSNPKPPKIFRMVFLKSAHHTTPMLKPQSS